MGLFNKKQRLWLVAFSLVYFLLFVFCHFNSATDPGSFFFQPKKGYRPRFSPQRIQESLQFLSTLNHTTNHTLPVQNADICVGIVTVKRPLHQNLDTTIGSILDGLSSEQRSTLAIHVLFALSKPSEHPSYNEPWVSNSNAIDRVLTYDQFSESNQIIVHDLERAKEIKKKSLIDYRLSLQSCYEDTNAAWFMMLEDDILAQKDWYESTTNTIQNMERWKHTSRINDWLYLRLFYTEKFLGWNSQYWAVYLAWSVAIVSLVGGAGMYSRRKIGTMQGVVTNPFLLVVCFICVPLLIGLYFLAGRVTVQPMKPGIHRMNRNGCCSQALVFPRAKVPLLMDRLEDMEDVRNPLAVDSVIERTADAKGFDRLAISPPLMQHVGAASYKEDKKKWTGDYSVRGAHGVWSMAFERGEVRDGLMDVLYLH